MFGCRLRLEYNMQHDTYLQKIGSLDFIDCAFVIMAEILIAPIKCLSCGTVSGPAYIGRSYHTVRVNDARERSTFLTTLDIISEA